MIHCRVSPYSIAIFMTNIDENTNTMVRWRTEQSHEMNRYSPRFVSRPNSGGISPDSRLFPISKRTNLLRDPKADGMGPKRSLFATERTVACCGWKTK